MARKFGIQVKVWNPAKKSTNGCGCSLLAGHDTNTTQANERTVQKRCATRFPRRSGCESRR